MRERKPAVIKQTVRSHHTPASVCGSGALTAGALHDLDLAPGYAPTAAAVFGEHAEALAGQYRELNQRLDEAQRVWDAVYHQVQRVKTEYARARRIEAKARRVVEDHRG